MRALARARRPPRAASARERGCGSRRERLRPARAGPGARRRSARRCARGPANVHRSWLRAGAGAPIVFMHGFGADLNGWRPVLACCPRRGRRSRSICPATASRRSARTRASRRWSKRRAPSDRGGRDARASRRPFARRRGRRGAGARAPGVKALSLMLIAPAGLGEETNAAFFDGFLQADTEAGLTPWLQHAGRRSGRARLRDRRTTLRQRRERPLVAEQRRLAEAHSRERPAGDSTCAAFSRRPRRRPRSSSGSRTASRPPITRTA